MAGALAELTVKLDALVAVVCPATSTVIGPVVAPLGTVAVIDVAVEAVTVAVVPLNFTVGEEKFDPVIVTLDPTAPELGLNPLIVGPVGPPPGELEFRGFGVPVSKSLELLLESVSPAAFLMIAVVLLGAGAAPEPSKIKTPEPAPTKSTTPDAFAALDAAKALVLLTNATLKAVPDIPMVPVASGVGKLAVPPEPAAC